MSVSKLLSNQIIDALSWSLKNLLSSELLEETQVKEDTLENALEEMKKVGNVRYSENRYSLIDPGNLPELLKVRYDIKEMISEERKPPTTRKIADELEYDINKIYDVCQSYERKGYVKKEKIKGERAVFFTPITGEVVTSRNYERINNLNSKLRMLVSESGLREPKMIEKVDMFFEELRQRKLYEKRRASINSFRKNMIKTLRYAEKRSDIHKSLGIIPFYPSVATWKPLQIMELDRDQMKERFSIIVDPYELANEAMRYLRTFYFPLIVEKVVDKRTVRIGELRSFLSRFAGELSHRVAENKLKEISAEDIKIVADKLEKLHSCPFCPFSGGVEKKGGEND